MMVIAGGAAVAALLVSLGDPVPAVAFPFAGLALVTVTRAHRLRESQWEHDPQRHLMWCRRREEAAHVLVVSLTRREAARAGAVLRATRVTDSLTTRNVGRGVEISGVLDGQDVDRTAVASRLVAVLGTEPSIGWAAFPGDGLTLEVLFSHARAEAQARQPLTCHGRRRLRPAARLAGRAPGAGKQLAEQEG